MCRENFEDKRCKKHIIDNYIIPYAFTNISKTIVDAQSWENVLNRYFCWRFCHCVKTLTISNSFSGETITKAKSQFVRDRKNISFGVELEAIRFVLELDRVFAQRSESIVLKKTNSLTKVAEEQILNDVASVEMYAAIELTAKKAHKDIYDEKKALLSCWKKSLRNLADREFELLINILYPVIVTEPVETGEEDDEELNMTEKSSDREGEDHSDHHQESNDQDDQNEGLKRGRSNDGDGDDDEIDGNKGPGKFVLEDLQRAKRGRMSDMGVLATLLTADKMSSKYEIFI